ncbi:MAG: ATP-dependent DNA ligase [Gemmataceae bacterium]
MKAFAELYAALDETNRTSAKVAALTRYFAAAPSSDAAWAVYFLIGRKPRQVIPSRRMWMWAIEAAGIPDWLFEESYHSVGDVAETITLVLPDPPQPDDRPLRYWVEERLLPLRTMPEAEQRSALLKAWAELDRPQRFVWNKLITGAFRVGVSQALVIRGLAKAGGIDAATVAHRLMGDWEPTPEFYTSLIATESSDADIGRPYPFFLAHPLEDSPESLGERSDWQVEWKWDGIRAQLIRRGGQVFLWSRGEELVTDRYPEIMMAATTLPEGTVLDGELLPWLNGAVLPFGYLQRRIGRKVLGKKILEEVPVILMTYDLLEHEGTDVRSWPLEKRRAALEDIIDTANDPRLLLSPLATEPTWEALALVRAESRSRRVEGMMLKRHASPYRVGRQRGDWWKWKVNPFTIDAVLIYAQRGNGKRAGLYTDYTFGLWDHGKLVPVAKAYSGLTDEEIRQVDSFVRSHTVEKFGPVRTVRPELVFELGFEGIQRSTRHKSGVAVRFPRMLRWRTDKKADEADYVETLRALIPEVPT